MKPQSLRLGKVQLRIMQILWERGQATAREITEDLRLSAPIAHSTVQTLLRKLEAKGAVAHDPSQRVFVFRPLHQQEEISQTASRDLLARFFGGSISSLVAHLLKNETVSPEERAQLRELINQASLSRTEEE